MPTATAQDWNALNNIWQEPKSGIGMSGGMEEMAAMKRQEAEYTGGSVSYYTIKVFNPTSGGEPYTVECNDVIEALQLDYASGNILKAIWRIAAARMGRCKKGYGDEVYDSEKIVFFGQRKLEQARGK